MKKLLIFLLLAAQFASAQTSDDSAWAAYEAYKQRRITISSPPVNMMKELELIQDSLDGVTSNEMKAFALYHQKRAYGFQYISSIVIFIIVVLIVFLGMYMSYQQFALSSSLLKKKGATSQDVDEAVKLMNANLELNKDGFKVNSAVIGLVILLLSLTFFFLYLKYVYPINVMKHW